MVAMVGLVLDDMRCHGGGRKGGRRHRACRPGGRRGRIGWGKAVEEKMRVVESKMEEERFGNAAGTTGIARVAANTYFDIVAVALGRLASRSGDDIGPARTSCTTPQRGKEWSDATSTTKEA
ncbi:hypothetical protein C1H46_007288 [Malus baccata]|uniref:Uncharacterized protein n=1 Tax=Malus baccata TaxID=106549 RepID=A0A540N7Q5_MALBA|nr:hypothetical protein C1H46_007288 [Malus baccata]